MLERHLAPFVSEEPEVVEDGEDVHHHQPHQKGDATESSYIPFLNTSTVLSLGKNTGTSNFGRFSLKKYENSGCCP